MNPVSKIAEMHQSIVLVKHIGQLPSFQFDADVSTPLENVIRRLKNHPESPGVLLRRGSVFIGVLSRLKIFERLGRPYGVELFFKKPISDLYTSINVSGEIYPSDMRISDAVQKSLSRPQEIRYEPLVVSFSEDDMRLLDINVLLLAQSDQLSNSNRIIEKQVKIGKVLSSSLELPKVLGLILEQMDSVIPYNRAEILLHRDGELFFTASQGYSEDINIDEARALANNNKNFTDILQTCESATVEDALLLDNWRHIPGTPPTRSWLGAPLIQNEVVLGMLSISRLMVLPFSLDEVEISAIFAGQAAVALGNANHYEKIQNFNHELEDRIQARTQDLQKAYYKLELLDKNKSDFIKITSHEIKTPITAVSGYAQMLSLDESLEPHQHEIINRIKNGMWQLEDILNTMLDVARLDTEEMKLEFSQVDLGLLISEIGDSLSKNMFERNIRISIEHAKGLPTSQGDTNALRKAFYHLIVNAIKFTPDGGHITITGRAPGRNRNNKIVQSSLQITVSDTGIGIDPKDHELIFDNFYQTGKLMLHSSGKTKFKGGGSGLGLSVARGIIEAHGGQIWAESPGHNETTNPGSSFHIILPATKLRAKI